MTRTMTIAALTPEAFAPFGDVIAADPAKMRLINGATTERFDALGRVEILGAGACAILSLFRAQPRAFPYPITMMERHPLGSQSFHPLDHRPWLVVVAQDESGQPGRPLVFAASGAQGINYRANIWHHPLMALEQVSNFLIVDRQGEGDNLEEYVYKEAFILRSYK